MKRGLPLTALAFGVSLSAACSPPTELMLVIKTGPGLHVANGAADAIDFLQVQAGPRAGSFFFSKSVDLCTEADQPGCRPQQYATTDYTGGLTMPIQLLLEPGSQGIDEEIHVWVDGYNKSIGGTQAHLISSGVHFKFSKGKRLWIELPLFGECVNDLDCEPTDTACFATGTDRDCVDVMPTESKPDGATAPDDAATSVVDLSGADLAHVDGGSATLDMSAAHDIGGVPGDMELNQSTDFAGCATNGNSCCPGMQCIGGECASTMLLRKGQPVYLQPYLGACTL